MNMIISDEAIDRALPALRRMVEQYEARRKVATQVVPVGEAPAHVAPTGTLPQRGAS